HAATARDVASAQRHENAREAARQGEEVHSRNFLCERTLTEFALGPISAFSNGSARSSRAGEAVGFGTFQACSSLLRGGAENFRLCLPCVSAAAQEVQARAKLCWRVASEFGLCLWSPGLLFDNCIGRKRDVGGGVLAGLWSLGWVFGVS